MAKKTKMNPWSRLRKQIGASGVQSIHGVVNNTVFFYKFVLDNGETLIEDPSLSAVLDAAGDSMGTFYRCMTQKVTTAWTPVSEDDILAMEEVKK